MLAMADPFPFAAAGFAAGASAAFAGAELGFASGSLSGLAAAANAGLPAHAGLHLMGFQVNMQHAILLRAAILGENNGSKSQCAILHLAASNLSGG